MRRRSGVLLIRVSWSAAILPLAAACGLTAWRGGSVAGVVLQSGVIAVGFATVGLVLTRRVPENAIGWLFLALGIVSGVAAACDAYAARSLHLPASPAAAVAAGLLDPFPLFVLPALLLIYPSGRLPSPRWKPVAAAWASATGVYLAAAVVWPGRLGLSSDPGRRNPIGIGGSLGHTIGLLGFAGLATSGALVVVAATSLVRRVRRARGIERQQLKWFAAAAVAICVLLPLGILLGSLSSPAAADVSAATAPIGATALIVATGIAVLRYRLYDIDVIVRRTIVYASLVAVLAGVYLGGLYVIDASLQAVTGQSSTLAVTVSTLVVVAVFQPLRHRIQRAVDRRFYRAKYDAVRTLEEFGGRLREQIDVAMLHADVLDIVRTTLQPRQASLWLRPHGPRDAD